MRKICTSLDFLLSMRKIFSPVHTICARLGKICLFPECAIYAQDLHKTVLISPMHNICGRFAQDYI